MKEDLFLIEEIFSTPNGHEYEYLMFKKIKELLQNFGYSYKVDSANNILVTKGNSDKMYAICCHIDSVFEHKNFQIKIKNNEIHAYNDKEHVGIGGDDKAGIFISFLLLKVLNNLKVIFFSSEEVGGIGSMTIDLNFFDNVKILAAIDRRNNSDFINKINNIIIFPEYEKYKNIIEQYGFKAATGIFCDLFSLYKRGLRIPMFNISAGYRNPHTEEEYVIISDMYKTYNFLKFFLPYYIKNNE